MGKISFLLSQDEKIILSLKPLKRHSVKFFLTVLLITYGVLLAPLSYFLFTDTPMVFVFFLAIMAFSTLIALPAFLYGQSKTEYILSTEKLYAVLGNGTIIVFNRKNLVIANEMKLRQKHPKVANIIITAPDRAVYGKGSLIGTPLLAQALNRYAKVYLYAIQNPEKVCDMIKGND